MPCYNNQRSMSRPPAPNVSYIVPRPPLAEARVTVQPPDSPTYDISTAFVKGTIYKELDKPFFGKGGCCK